jgi:hypothetical protein
MPARPLGPDAGSWPDGPGPTTRDRVAGGVGAGCRPAASWWSGSGSASTAGRPGWAPRRPGPAAPRRRPPPRGRRRGRGAASRTRPPVAEAGRGAATAPTAAERDPAVAGPAPRRLVAAGRGRRERQAGGRGGGRPGRRRGRRPKGASPALAGVGTGAAGSAAPRPTLARCAGGSPRCGRDRRGPAGWCRPRWPARRSGWASHSRPTAA